MLLITIRLLSILKEFEPTSRRLFVEDNTKYEAYDCLGAKS